jgi:hypothetical protein
MRSDEGVSSGLSVGQRRHGSFLTQRWRETDSNLRSPVREPTHASFTYDRYRRLSAALRHLRPPTVAVAIRADTVVGSTRYIANLQCLRLSHYAVSNKTRIVVEYREHR